MCVRTAFCYIKTPHVLMREEPKETSKVISDAFYSEEITVLKDEQNGWLKIRTNVDGYEGWIEQSAVALHGNDFFAGRSVAVVDRLKAYIYGVQDTEYGGAPLPFESRLKIVEEPDAQQKRWIKVELVNGDEVFVQRGDIKKNPSKLSMKEMVEFSRKFLDVAYAWGGRSSFGFDCSGLVQMFYRQMGVKLPRDSKDQFAWKGFNPVDMEELISGDLIFFGPAEDKIRHVGMYLGGNQFIHSTVKELKPYVHISNLKDEDWNGSGTLTFRAGRRLKPPQATHNSAASSLIRGAAFGLAITLAVCRILKK